MKNEKDAAPRPCRLSSASLLAVLWLGCGLPPGVAGPTPGSPSEPDFETSPPGSGGPGDVFVPPGQRPGDVTPSTPIPVDPSVKGLDVSPQLPLGLPDDSSVGVPTRWLLVRPQWVISYDTTRKVPRWSSWTLSAADLGAATRLTTFLVDPLLPSPSLQASNDDYTASGFDRGHLCPSADRTASDTDNDATFFLTNIVPQLSESNSGPWLGLENEGRQQVRQGKKLAIVAGPIFGNAPTSIGDGVGVPEAMFKVVVILDDVLSPAAVSTATEVIAAIVPNTTAVSGSNWQDWRVSVDDIEARTGLDLLADLPDDIEAALEARR